MTLCFRNLKFQFFASMIFFAGSLNAQNILIKGKVRDPGGKPMQSVSVIVKEEPTKGTKTDSMGLFSLRVSSTNDLLFSAIGYRDTLVKAGSQPFLQITMFPSSVELKNVLVSGKSTNETQETESLASEVAKELAITNTFQDFIRGAEFSNGILAIHGLSHSGATNTFILGFGPLNTLNSGTTLTQITHQEETKGSRYLLKNYANGVIIDSQNNLIRDSSLLLNYDKIDGQLIIAKDAGHYTEIDKEKIKAFAFKTQDSSYVFINVPLLSKRNFFMLIANGPKYSIYKSVKTVFIKANYTNNGLVETGHNYDEYVDVENYYWIDEMNGKAGLFELKKKAIKLAFDFEKDKVQAFMNQHKYDDIDEAYLRKLIEFINK